MATTNVATDLPNSSAAPASTLLLVNLVSLSHESFEQVVAHLAQAFPGESVTVASPDIAADGGGAAGPGGAVRVVGYTPSIPSPSSWTLTASDYVNAHELAQKYQPRAILQLGAEAQSLEPATLLALADAVLNDAFDLAVPRYDLPARAGLVNSGILYPITRALFGTRPRFPLAVDLGLSPRMAERLATVGQRYTAANQLDALVWPVAEASVAGFSVGEVEAGTRTLPQPGTQDLNSMLAQVAGSLFADVDAKAAYWQRSRVAQTGQLHTVETGVGFTADDVQPMLDSFRLAYGNLHEIWSLVLPPQSLLGLKRLSVMPPASFRMPDSLWARIVYDFLLAYRLRTINRGHLLGALTPLYLAWVASHILLGSSGTEPERHIEAVAAAFETDKAYLVSRWRWPDRFNP